MTSDVARLTIGDETVRRFDGDGMVVVERAVSPGDVERMVGLFPRLGDRWAGTRSAGFGDDARVWLGAHAGLTALASRLLGGRARAVRHLAFDKSDSANWFVPWHQDRSADGRERSTGELERMVALRVHLDDCDADNGPLEVLAGSHALGRLDAARIAALVRDGRPLVCLAARGDVVAMRPLAVHRSQRAVTARHRRVLHIEYIAGEPSHAA